MRQCSEGENGGLTAMLLNKTLFRAHCCLSHGPVTFSATNVWLN